MLPVVVATQEIASRSPQSRVKAILTCAPLSQAISNPSEHDRVSGQHAVKAIADALLRVARSNRAAQTPAQRTR